MTEVRIHVDAINSSSLPSVCVLSGATEGIEWRTLRLSYQRAQDGGEALVSALMLLHNPLHSIVREVVREVEGWVTITCELPMAVHAWRAWRIARMFRSLAGLPILMPATFAVILSLFGRPMPAAAVALAIVAGLAIGIMAFAATSRFPGPRLLAIDPRDIATLEIPSAVAAEAIRRYVGPARVRFAPAPPPVPSEPLELKKDQRSFVCASCGTRNRVRAGGLPICIQCGAHGV